MWLALCRWLLNRAPQAYGSRYRDEILADLTRGSRPDLPPAARWRWRLAAVADLWRTVNRERRADRTPLWTDLSGDLRYAWRSWRRAPAFAVTVVLTLAVGLGLTAAILAFADGYLFRALPFPGGDRVYWVSDPNAAVASALKASDVEALRATEVAAYGFVEWSAADTGDVAIGGRKVSILAYQVTQGFRETIALPLMLGRDFAADDHRDGAPLVGWLSHRFWLRQFGGDPGVVGRVVPFESMSGPTELTIVGVLGPAFTTLDANNPPPYLIVPERGPRRVGPNALAFPYVRIPETETPEIATSRIAAALDAVAPTEGRPREVRLASLRDGQTRGGRPTAQVLLSGALLVLALAVSSLIHLLLGRSAVRQAEFATRLSLGASRWRVVRVFLMESLLLGGTGIVAGLGVGKALASIIEARIPQMPTGSRSLALVPILYDWRIVAAATILGGALVLVGGLWPAWRALRWSVAPGRVPRGVLRGILASETATATVILIGAGTIGLGIYRYLHQPLGFEYEQRYRLVIWGPDGRGVRGADAQAALEAVRSVRDVRTAALSTSVFGRVDDALDSAVDATRVQVLQVPDGWPAAWGINLRAGRFFEPGEFAVSARAAVVNDVFSGMMWPDRNPLGQTLVAGKVRRTVVGVISTPRWQLSRELAPIVYVPADRASLRAPIVIWASASLARQLDAGNLAPLTHGILAAVPGVSVDVRAQTFDNLFMRDIGEPRFQTPIVTAFGVLAIVLAGVGIFGLVSYVVAQRAREFGIRVAVGATRAQVWKTVMGEAIRPAAAGLAVGLGAAWWLQRFVEATAFSATTPRPGPPVFLAVSAVVILVVAVAALIPASRAARMDPVATLRAE